MVYTTLPFFPRQTEEVGGGLPALEEPDVAEARAHWLAHIDKMGSAKGVDSALLARVRTMVAEEVRSDSRMAPLSGRATAALRLSARPSPSAWSG